MVIHGRFKVGYVNANNRFYPIEVMKKAVEEAQTRIANRTFLAYLYDSPNPPLHTVVGIVKAITMDGDEVSVDTDLLMGTDAAKPLQGIPEDVLNTMLDTRAGGQATLETGPLGEEVVQDDYSFSYVILCPKDTGA